MSKLKAKYKKKLKRKKYQTSQGAQYALPTSITSQGPLETNVQANLSDDPAKSKQSLINQNLAERELQKTAKEDREREIQERRDRDKQQMQAQGLQVGDEVAKLAKDKLAANAASTASTVASVMPTPPISSLTQGMLVDPAQQVAGSLVGETVPGMGADILAKKASTEVGKVAAKEVGKEAVKEVGKEVVKEGAKKGIQMGSSSNAVTPIALAANLGGMALKTFGADDDDTTYNTAEVSGGLLQKAGEFGGYGALAGTILPGIGNVVGGIVGGIAGLGVSAAQMVGAKRKAIKEKEKLDAKEAETELLAGTRESELFRQAYGTTGRDLGFNVNQQSQNSYLGSNQMVRAGGRKQLQASSNPNSNPGSFDADKAMSPLSSFMSMLAPTPVGPPNNSFTNSKEPVEESSEESERGGIGTYIKDKGVEATRYLASSLGVPSNIVAMAQNTLGIDTPMGKDMFSKKEQEAMIEVIQRSEKDGRNFVTYKDYDDAGDVFKQNKYSAFFHPQTSVRTTLGQFEHEKQEDGSYDIKDSYGFNPSTQDAHNVTKLSKEELDNMSFLDKFTTGLKANENLEPLQRAYQSLRYHTAPYGQDKDVPVNFNVSMREGGKISQYKKGGRKVPGGEVIPLPGGAVEFKGNKHFESGNGSDSGIILEKSTATKQGVEVEDGETMGKIKFKGGKKDDYIFSEYLKLGGVSFAQRHKSILKKGGSQKEIQQLAKLQEEKAKQVGKTPVGPTDQYGARGQEYIARYGGVKPRKMAQASLINTGISAGMAANHLNNVSGDDMSQAVKNSLAGMTGVSGMLSNVSPGFGMLSSVVDPLYNKFVYDPASNMPANTPAGIQQELEPSSAQLQNTQNTQNTQSNQSNQSNQNTQSNQTRSAAPAQNTGSTPTNQQPPSGDANREGYEDELIDVGGTQFAGEYFKNQGKGSNIDYSGNIEGGDWKEVLKSQWAKNIVGDREVNSKEDLQKIYNEDYVPQVESYFEDNPEQAYNSIVEFANSGHPNASNLKKKIYKNGKLLSEDQILDISLKFATDGKVGTFHSLFTGAPSQEEIVAPDPKTGELPTNTPEAEIKDFPAGTPEEVQKASLQLKAPRVRDIPPLAYLGAASQALGPAMALATKYDQPERVSPGNIGREQLARVNYNSERAATLNNSTATTRHIQNNVSGPGGIAAILAGNEASRKQFLDIASKEALANRQIQNAETQMNANISSKNVGNDLQAQSRNAQAQNVRDQAEYEKRINAYGAIGNIGGQFASDALQYKAVNRQARANQIAGEFTRQEYTEALSKRPKYRRMLKKAGIDPNDMRSVKRIAANMWDPTLTQEELDQKVLDYAEANKDQEKEDKAQAGGKKKYTKRTGKIRRKK